jgi:hypothetical protein
MRAVSTAVPRGIFGLPFEMNASTNSRPVPGVADDPADMGSYCFLTRNRTMTSHTHTHTQ